MVLGGFTRSAFLHINLEWGWAKGPNLLFEFLSLLHERAGIMAKVKFPSNTGMYDVCIDICSRKVGRSEGLFERLKIANWEAMCELEWKFGVVGEQLRVFEERLELCCWIWCEDFWVVIIIIIEWRFYLQVIKINVRLGDKRVGSRSQRSPVSVKWSQCRRCLQEELRCHWHLRGTFVHRLHDQRSHTMNRHAGKDDLSCSVVW